MSEIKEFLNIPVGGKKQTGIITNISYREVTDKDLNVLPKLSLTIKTTNNEFDVDEAWVYSKDNECKPQGLWIRLDSNKELNSMSTVAKLLEFLNLSVINDLYNKEVLLYPKSNGYLAVVACNNSMFK